MIKTQNNEVYSPDFFIHNSALYNNQTISIDEQLSWLTKELNIVK